MPEISRFYGIVIYMFAKDHAPPHVHVRYSEHAALIDIRTGELHEGHLPRRALRLVQDWTELHRSELERNWIQSQTDSPSFQKVDPLE